MYDNIFLEMQNLRKPTVIKPGGWCKIYIAKHEDVAQWPAVNTANSGILDYALQLKEGKTLYIIDATQRERSLNEKTLLGPEGPAVEIIVNASLAGNTINNTLGLNAMLFHKYVLIVEDRDGIARMVGNQDAGASLSWDFTTGNQNASRGRNLKWTWIHSQGAPIYNGGPIISDITQVFTQLSLLIEFEVGALGAGEPMDDTDTTFTDDDLINRNFIMLADGVLIPQVVRPGFRHCTKPFNSNTITVNGGVTHPEIISIYLIQ
jgi:hypothetical protein